VGKSTVAEGLISWLRYAEIDFAAIDADGQHLTLSNRYPDQVGIFDATKTLDVFSRLIQTLPASPVILVDFPAQATDFLLSAVNHFRLLEFFEHSNVRPTLLVFAADDPTAKESASNTVRLFGDKADYLLIENPARFKSTEFSRTALGSWLRERSTPTLHIPTVTAVTMNAWEALEDKIKRYLSPNEVCRQTELHELSRTSCNSCETASLSSLKTLQDISGVTEYLNSGGTTEIAQRIAGHTSPSTTRIYDRSGDQLTLQEIERVQIGKKQQRRLGAYSKSRSRPG
jgi:hypothetical protein